MYCCEAGTALDYYVGDVEGTIGQLLQILQEREARIIVRSHDASLRIDETLMDLHLMSL